jgi:inhibitor of cysteine peptidase
MTRITMRGFKTCPPAPLFYPFSPFRKVLLCASLGLLLVVVSAFRLISGPLVLTSADNGRTVTVSSGKQVIIQLPENSGSTGYTWNFTTSRNQVLTLQNTTYLPASHPMPGAPGTVVFTFLAHDSGSVQIHFQLQRPWELTVPPAQRFTVTIQVQPGDQHQLPLHHTWAR